AGLHGPDDVLNGSRGFFRAYADEWKAEELVRDNESFLIETIYRKPYASCRHSHSAVEAALKLREEYGLKPEEIRRIEVRTYALAVKGHDHASVPNATTAKMSIPYSVAVSIVRGDANYQAFEEESLGDERALELMKKVAVCEDPELSKLVPAKRAAIVTVYTDRGVFTKRVDYPKGEPENPITVKELEEKLFSLGKTAGKSEEELEKIRRAVWNIETDFTELTELL
ncbi:MAG: MmgE/PrpD family protein, partial [Erysipelotrichales bacterium]|nr:MmgE/PrpD family protein [Erysipelotrichales bacterium]